jgi:FkbM family methyltransferase
MVIFDAGACVGAFIDYCLKEYESPRIYAFEPLKVNFNYLQEKYTDSPNVTVVNFAVSDRGGTANLYKKKYANGKGFDFAGNEGCSLIPRKSNVSSDVFEVVNLISLPDFMQSNGIEEVDILKLDVEGNEYVILNDLLESGGYKRFKKIMYEDHCRKIKGLEKEKEVFLSHVRLLDIEDMFWRQNEHGDGLKYTPLKSYGNG